MQGRRVEWTSQILAPGEYAKLPDGTFHAATPNGHIGNLSAHDVVLLDVDEKEWPNFMAAHPDRKFWQRSVETFETLTLTPSVDASQHGHWHGFVTNGDVT